VPEVLAELDQVQVKAYLDAWNITEADVKVEAPLHDTTYNSRGIYIKPSIARTYRVSLEPKRSDLV
jgi:hypothetical protein